MDFFKIETCFRWLSSITIAMLLLCSSSVFASGGNGHHNPNKGNVLYGDWPVVGQGYENLQQPDSSNINTSNAAALLGNPIWTFDATSPGGTGVGGITGSPAVADGVAYFGDGFPPGGAVYAVNIETGALIWKAGPFWDGPTFITTPVLSKDRVYIASANQLSLNPFVAKMYCIDRHTGALLWSQEIGPVINHEGKTYQPNDYTSDPTIVENLVIVGISSTENFSESINVPPVIDHKSRGGIVAFDRFTGEKKWMRFTTSNQNAAHPKFGAGAGVWSSPAVDLKRKLIYIGTGQSFENPASPLTDSLLAIHYRTGKIAWRVQFTANDVWSPFNTPSGADYDVSTHPNLFSVKIPGEGHVDYVGVADKRGKYYIIRRDQDRRRAKIDAILTLDKGTADGAIQSTPTIDDKNDMLYISSGGIRTPSGTRVSVGSGQLIGADSFTVFVGVADPKVEKYDLRQLLTNISRPQDSLVWSSENLIGFPFDDSGQTMGPLTLINNEVLVVTFGNGNIALIDAQGVDVTANGPAPVIIAETGPSLGDNPAFIFPPFPFRGAFGGATVVGDYMLVPTVNMGPLLGQPLPGGGIQAYKLPATP